jgi:deoxyinosine 3'endonuclease (endonuclease V)
MGDMQYRVNHPFVDDRIITWPVVFWPSLKVIGYVSVIFPSAFFCIPVLLSFREGPLAIRAQKKAQSDASNPAMELKLDTS